MTCRIYIGVNCELNGALINNFPLSPSPFTKHKSERIDAPGARSRPWVGVAKNKKSISLSDQPANNPMRCWELVLGSGLISSLLKLVSWKSLLQALQLRLRKVGFSEAFPELDFHRAQAADNRDRDNKQRGWKETGLYARGKFAVPPPLPVVHLAVWFTCTEDPTIWMQW